MKKTFIFLFAVLALVACSNEDQSIVENSPVANEMVDATTVKFNFIVNRIGDNAGTRAVKAGWELGDKVFVFFNGLTTGYVTFEYGASDWAAPALQGTGDIPVSGTLTAVFLPYGSGATPSYSTSWTFDDDYYAYYMKAEKVAYSYDSGTNTITATLNMENPADFVQFYFEGDYTGCKLETDCIIPSGLASIASDGTIAEISGFNAGDPMNGYTYGTGTQFSGKLTTQIQTYDGAGNANGYGYYFILNDGGHKSVFFKQSATALLASHSAIKLPTFASGKWFQVGADYGVEINGVTWATVNVGATDPWEDGSHYTFANRASEVPGGWSVPASILTLKNDVTKYWTSVKGRNGYIVIDTDAADGNFIFLPAAGYGTSSPATNVNDCGYYWTSSPEGSSKAYRLYFTENEYTISSIARTYAFSVRPIQ